MSVKGFLLKDGTTAKYDYNELDNLPVISGGGLTSDAKNALLNCFAHVAWVDANGQDYCHMLEEALFNDTWRIAKWLNNCTISNAAGSVAKDAAYTATITPMAGYTLTGATVSVTMGGTDITATAYNNGTITIASVTGVLVISATAVVTEATLASISAVYIQSGTVYPFTSLDSLKRDLAVTATYSNSTTAIVSAADYTLSGTLTEGTSTVTVTYGGKTATFSVTVTSGASTYQRVEYIEATGTQGFALDNAFGSPAGRVSAVIECSATKSGGAQLLIAFAETVGNWFGLGANVNFGFGTTAGTYFANVDPTSFQTYSVTWGESDVSATCGNETIGRTYSGNSYGKLTMFYAYKGQTVGTNNKGYYTKGKVKSCQITVDGVLAYDLIPCYRVSDNEIGMLNRVTGDFYTNDASGTFLKGDDIAW